MQIDVGDLITVPILPSTNLEGNCLLAEDFKPSSCKEEVVCEIATILKTDDVLNILLYVPKGAGWSFVGTDGQLTGWINPIPPSDREAILDKIKILQHNGWWISSKAIKTKVDGTW